jgi:transcriptional regulator with XRE-family HTH domain
MTVNERIKECRHALKLSQREFARGAYVSNGFIAELELGHAEANERLIHLISLTYGVSKKWLLTGEGAMLNATPDEKLERMTGFFTGLSPELQDCLLEHIENLLKVQETARKKAAAYECCKQPEGNNTP